MDGKNFMAGTTVLTEAEARKLTDKILAMVFNDNQWCRVEYSYKGKELDCILIKEISIKIKK